jgi:hypothetical protein
MPTAPTKPFVIRLVCKSMPAVPSTEDELDVGIQDKAQNVHRGRVTQDGSVYFECTIEAKLDTPALDFRGPFVHGTPQGRFIYLSWKRRSGAAAPWYWRVKVPLAGITQKAVTALKPGEVVLADISGRRPHSTEPIMWNSGLASAAEDAV